MPQRDPRERSKGYHPIELGLAEEDAQLEANRCLRCDLCIGCGLCELACSEVGAEALRMEETSAGRLVFDDFTRPASRCVGCGACAAVCPTGAIRVVDEGGNRSTIVLGTLVSRQPLLTCDDCRQPFATEAQINLMRGRLAVGEPQRLRCPACARRAAAATSGLLAV